MYKPYTYYLFHKPTGKKYYGVQYRSSGICANPDNLWKTYFSSSKEVNNLIELYGKDSFLFEVRKVFETREEAFLWEQKVIRRINAVEKKDWLNKHYWKGHLYHDGGPMRVQHK